MSLIVAIETSSSAYFVALGEDGVVLYDSGDIAGLNDNKDLGLLLKTGLEKTGRSARVIDYVSINIGPGGLGAVRSGVSFANGLAFGIGRPLIALNAFELVGFEAAKTSDHPILITSNAADGYAYGGLYRDGALVAAKYGLLEDTAKALTNGISHCCLAGTHQDKLENILSGITCEKSDIKFASATTQIEFLSARDMGRFISHEPVAPLNELSSLFDEKANDKETAS